MRTPTLLSLFFGVGLASTALAQYGYTPPVPPTPPAPPPMPSAPTYPSYTPPAAMPPAGTGTAGYSTPVYSDPAYSYGGYTPQTPGYGPAPAAPAPVGPDILSYGSLEGYYLFTDFKDSSLEGSHGFGVALSAELFKPLFIKGQFGWGSSGGGSEEDGGFDFNSFGLGGGAYLAISPRFHLLGEVGGKYANVDADEDSLSFSEGQFYVRPAIRFAIAPTFELQGGITLSSADDFDSTVIDLAAYWKVASMFDIGGGAGFGDSSTQIKAGIRLRW